MWIVNTEKLKKYGNQDYIRGFIGQHELQFDSLATFGYFESSLKLYFSAKNASFKQIFVWKQTWNILIFKELKNPDLEAILMTRHFLIQNPFCSKSFWKCRNFFFLSK